MPIPPLSKEKRHVVKKTISEMGYEKGWSDFNTEEMARSKMTQFITEDFDKKCLILL